MANNDSAIWAGGSPEWAAYYNSQGKLPVPGSQKQSKPIDVGLDPTGGGGGAERTGAPRPTSLANTEYHNSFKYGGGGSAPAYSGMSGGDEVFQTAVPAYSTNATSLATPPKMTDIEWGKIVGDILGGNWNTPAPTPVDPTKPTTPLNLMDLVAKYPKLKENPQEMAQLWMADAIKYFPNIGNAYMESANAATDNYNKQYGSLEQIFNALGPQLNALMQQQQGEYFGIANNMAQMPQYALDKFAELGITADQYNNAVQQAAVGNYENINAIKGIVNNAGLDFNALTASTTEQYDALRDQSGRLNQSQQDIYNKLQQYLTDYSNKTGQSSDAISSNQEFLKNLLTKSGIDFEGALSDQRDAYGNLTDQSQQTGQKQQDLAAQLQQYLTDYTNKSDQTSAGLGGTQDFLKNLLQQSGIDFENLLGQQQGEYAGFKGEGEGLQAGAADAYQGIQDKTGDIWQQMWDAQQATKTGQLDPRTQAYIDQIYSANESLLDQSLNETISDQRKQLIDQMAGRGILSSGVTGRAYGEMLDSALRQKQKGMTEILKERAQTSLGMPFQQAEAANKLLQYTDQAKNLTQVEQQQLLDTLQTRYNMSKENAQIALQNLTSGTQAGISGAGQQQQGYQIDAATQKAVMEQASKMTADQSDNLINMLQTNANMTREQATLAIQNLTSSGQMGISGATAQQQGIQVDNAAQQALMDAARGMSQDQVNGMINALQTNANMTRDQAAAAVQTLTSKNQAQLQGSQQVQTGLAQTPEMMNQMINTIKGLTESELNSVVNTLQTQYNMSHQNAQLALQNLMQGNTAMLQTIAQQGATNAAPMDMWAKMFDQYGALGSHFVDQLVQQYESALDRQAQIDAAKAGKPSGSSGSGLLGSIIGSICVREDSLITMLDGKLKPANSIKVGDKILGYDVKLNTYIPQIIKETYISKFKHYYRITLANGTKLYTSEYHPCLISKKGKKIWAVNNYYNAVKNIVKRVLRKPWSVFTNFKWLWKATVNYTNMKVGQNMVLDKNNNTSQITKIETIVDKAKFCNFKTTEYKKSTFIANGVVVEGLNDWTGTFMEWVEKSGNYPKVKGE